MHLSQSSVSRTVKQIETRLGARLLDRDTRNVGLTAEGRELLEIAEDTLAHHRDGMTRMQTFLAGGRGTVSIATLPSVAASLLPAVISAFLAEHPDVQVRIHDELSETVLHQVATGLVDFGVTIAPGPIEGISATPLAVDRFYALLRSDHPLTARESVSWAELARQPFIALGADSSVRVSPIRPSRAQAPASTISSRRATSPPSAAWSPPGSASPPFPAWSGT